MKKIISLGIASAVCALTAISASAAGAGYDVKGDIIKDEVVTIDVIAGQDTTGLSFKVDATGLDVQDVTSTSKAMLVRWDAATKTFMISDGTGKVVAKAGDVLCTISAKVTADPGAEVSLALVDGTGKYTAFLPDEVYKATVKGAVTPGTSSDVTPGTSSGTTSDDTSKPDDEKIPGTGVALAVVPVVLAAAGVVVAKKRK